MMETGLQRTAGSIGLIKFMKRVHMSNGIITKELRRIRWNSSFPTSRRNHLPDRFLYSPLQQSVQKNVKFFQTWRHFSSTFKGFSVSEEVRMGVKLGDPVVALESAIISHGMPYPDNIQTALHLQSVVREQGAIPATIGVINGQLKVGLSDEEIQSLGTPKKDAEKPMIKVSRRDIPIALSQRLSGGTTVAATIIGAEKAGIHIFATGGIGGVHRGVERSYDISADLRELGRNGITVVAAGVKSILDIGKTLEYLETEGVCVTVLKKTKGGDEGTPISFRMEIEQNGGGEGRKKQSGQIGSAKFPSFFTAESQFAAPYLLTDEVEAAHLVNSSINFKLKSGILIAVPIPKEHEAEGQRIEGAIRVALEKAEELNIRGRDMTPFLLSEINRLTAGASLDANKCLVENNVKVATRIAILLSKLRKRQEGLHSAAEEAGSRQERRTFVKSNMLDTPLGIIGNTFSSLKDQDLSQHAPTRTKDNEHVSGAASAINLGSDTTSGTEDILRPRLSGDNQKRPIVVGGSSMDVLMCIKESELVMDGRTHKTQIRTVPGGVGRNIAEALAKLKHQPILISPIGNDVFGQAILRQCTQLNMDTSQLCIMKEDPTAVYSAIVNLNGECLFGLGDMTIYDRMNSQVINRECEKAIRENASIVIIDGNLTPDVMTFVLSICLKYDVPVWFEPTEVRKSKKIGEIPQHLWSALAYISPNQNELQSIAELYQGESLANEGSQFEDSCLKCFSMFDRLQLILLTKGKEGIQIVSRRSLLDDINGTASLDIINHPAPDLGVNEIKSVSGAGDCLTAGFVSGILDGLSWSECAIRGTLCAKKSLLSLYNVPERL